MVVAQFGTLPIYNVKYILDYFKNKKVGAGPAIQAVLDTLGTNLNFGHHPDPLTTRLTFPLFF